MLRIAICDDNTSFLNQIQNYVLEWNNNVYIRTFSDGDELITTHQIHPFDIILLDIVMPLINGIDTAKEIRTFDDAVNIIFLTSSVEYAIDSYSVKANNYLLKPIDKNLLFSSLDNIAKEKLVNNKFILVKSSSVTHRLFIDSIEYIEAQNKNTIIHFTDGTHLKSNDRLYYFEELLLPEDGFFKCNRSYIINVYHVNSYTTKEVTMQSGTTISLSRKLHQEFENIYFSTFFNKVGDN